MEPDETFEDCCPTCGQVWETCPCTLEDLLDVVYEHQLEVADEY